MFVMKAKPALLVTVFLCCIGWMNAQEQTLEVSAREWMHVGNNVEGISAVQQHTRNVQMNAGEIHEQLRSVSAVRVSDFPISLNETGRIELVRTAPVVDQRTIIETAKGKRIAPVVHSFQGYVEGTNDRVFLASFGAGFVCAITKEDGTKYSISPSVRNTKSNHVIMREDALGSQMFPEQAVCGTVESALEDELSDVDKYETQDRVLSFDLRELDLAVETDSYLYANFNGDLDALEQYVIALVAMISDIYERDLQVKIHLSYLYMYTNEQDGDPDPYTSGHGEVGDMLYEFGEYWSSNRSQVPRDLAHLLSAYPSGGGVIGVAWTGSNNRGTICRKNRFSGYGASGIRGNEQLPTSEFTSAVATMAHELGHNFGAPHTHNCWWQDNGKDLIDTCMTQLTPTASDGCLPMNPVPTLGTLMSYCFNVNATRTVAMEFHPVVIEQMRGNVENSACMNQFSGPTLFINSPSGNEHVQSQSLLDIGWTSVDVSEVTLQWKYNEPASEWTDIATVAAAKDSYSWVLPDVEEAEIVVRVVDASNPNLYDEILAPIQVQGPLLQVVRPEGAEKIATNSEYTIRWDRRFISAVNIDFSADGGLTWERIASNVEGGLLDWEVPVVVTSEARIRISEASTRDIIDESDLFELGTPFISILYPVGGEEFVSGTDEIISWEADFVNRVRIDYSLDGGTTWRLVSFSFPGDRGEFPWSVPNIEREREDSVYLQFRILDDVQQTVFKTVQAFSIAKEPTSVDNILETTGLSAFTDGYTAVVTNSKPQESHYNVSIVTMSGETVATQTRVTAAALQAGVNLPVGELAAGAYFVRLQGDESVETTRFTIVR